MEQGTRSWRPTPSMAVAMLALFVALSGTAFALARDEVRSRHIKDGHVRIADIDGEAVTNAKLGPLSVSNDKIQNNAVDTPQIAADAVDTAEIANDAVEAPQIANSAVGSPEIGVSAVKATELGTLNVRSNSVTVNAGQTGTVTANCEAFEQVVSGGGEWAQNFDVALGNSEPAGNGWKVAGDNQSTAGQSLTAHAYCLEA